MTEQRSWYWEIQGRYGRWYVDRYDNLDTSHGTYGEPIQAKSRKNAQEIANALNWAYQEGRRAR